jgi:hypothetical protein|tara:strand:- start:2 stop:901 length:900 start_codon:yes stop_codon:yes gene_type:complete
MFINKQKGIQNNDVTMFKDLNYYLDLTKNFKSSFSEFKVLNVNGINVIDESLACPVGYKARSGELLIQQLLNKGIKEIVYVQPRRGFAGISLSYLCKKYGLNLTLIMPSSKEISDHQALCIEYGAKPLFARIAAMPNANRLAKLYADVSDNRYFIPLGLNHELVIAGGVRAVSDFFKNREHPKTMWSVISTGVLTRSLQIALPNTEFKAIAVSRNIQQGELGKAEFMSYHKPFNSKSDLIPKEFNCENSYDSKGWEYAVKNGKPGDWFFNVAGNAELPKLDKLLVDSYRDWNDLRDFKI